MEDLTVGQRFAGGPAVLTAEEISDFAQKFDPQDFHLSEETAKDTMFGTQIASGWHTGAVHMRLMLAALPKFKGGLLGRKIENLSWTRPVKPGDQLFFEGEITDLRTSHSTPGRGIMRLKSQLKNQDGDKVLEMEAIVFVPRKEVTT